MKKHLDGLITYIANSMGRGEVIFIPSHVACHYTLSSALEKYNSHQKIISKKRFHDLLYSYLRHN